MSTNVPGKSWQMVVVANDFHVPFHDERALGLLLTFVRKEKPERLILAGDFMDFWEISSFDKTPRAGKELTAEIRIGRQILRSLRRTLPSARITWIEGNHEFRLRKYLIKNARELYNLPGLSVPELFGLDGLAIEFVPCQEGASRFIDTFTRVGKLRVGHFAKVSKHGGYAAKALVEDKGVSLLQGHTHRFGAHARTMADGQILLGIENLSMCSPMQSYVSRPNWQAGFSVIYLEPHSGKFQWYPVLIGRHGFVWRDRLFTEGRITKARIASHRAA